MKENLVLKIMLALAALFLFIAILRISVTNVEKAELQQEIQYLQTHKQL